ncbi:unnamed protein product [Linum tenue]|uniref:Uncharacterized protein n=1 Tax=Linum tenue TaxID=586396 RepID=A0AAV0MD57_9ROSI|nr:unnamed protein product [Linum tenue]
MTREACGKPKSVRRPRSSQSLVLRREHVIGNRVYTTRARFDGRNRQISIDCNCGSDARLSFAVEGKRVLQIKRLKWKFRGIERVEVDGVPIEISWDVYNWLFEDVGSGGGHAVFMFRFEGEEEEYDCDGSGGGGSGLATPLTEKSGGDGDRVEEGEEGVDDEDDGGEEFVLVADFDVADVVGGTNSSVMEWASIEESELGCGPQGFSLLVCAWKK